MSEPTRVFGVIEDAYPDVTTEASSPLDDLIEELAADVEKVTTVTYDIPNRPGWWVRFDTEFDEKRMVALAEKMSGKNGARAAFMIIAETCIEIGKGDQVVFGVADVGGVRRGPFVNGAVEKALGDKMPRTPDEPTWRDAIRWVLAVGQDVRYVVDLAGAVQAANAGTVVEHAGGSPTE